MKKNNKSLVVTVVVLAVSLVFGLVGPITVRAAGPAVVNLGTAGNFVVLTKSGISATGVTSITGNIGVSPIAASAITGFGLILDASNAFSTSALVTGKIYASDYAPSTPAMMTTAISDMQTAYTDAAGRSMPDYTELYAGDITGQTLAPGLYKWGTGVLISSAGVTISGTANDVWIFQIAGTLTVGNGAIVTLGGNAQAQNIFWQVADQTTLGTTSQFKGVILDQTAVVMNTGATLNGRILAQTATTLDASTITSGAYAVLPPTPPIVVPYVPPPVAPIIVSPPSAPITPISNSPLVVAPTVDHTLVNVPVSAENQAKIAVMKTQLLSLLTQLLKLLQEQVVVLRAR